MFQPRHLLTALALAFGLILMGCGGATSAFDEIVEEFDGNDTPSAPAPLVITTTSVPAGEPGVSYPETTLSAVAPGQVTWRVKSGSLPTGMHLSTDGRLQGTPSDEGLYEFTAQATSGAASGERALVLAVGTFGVRATFGLRFGDAWTGKPVTLQTFGAQGPVSFEVHANRSGGRLQDVNATNGTGYWLPGATAGIDILRVRDTATGEVAELMLTVQTDPTDTHMARFAGNDVWFLDWHAKHGVHAYGSDMRAAMAHVGLRSRTGYGAGITEADRLAELAVQLALLRQMNDLFGRNRDGTTGVNGLPISFAFERPGAGYVAPGGGTLFSGRSNGYSVMSLCYRSGPNGAIGMAFGDSIGNANHEHNAPGGGFGDMGVFVNAILPFLENTHRVDDSLLKNDPVHDGDIEALKAIVYELPNPGGRYHVLQYRIESLARCVGIVAAHEIGHSLGLDHTTSYISGAIMNSNAVFSPNLHYHFTEEEMNILRAGLPGPGRTGLQALKVAGGIAALASMAPGGVHVCGGCSNQ